LAVQLSYQLEAEGVGAQAFHLFLYRVDNRVMRLSVNAARATRDAEHIARLFANRADRLEGEYDAGFGIDMIRLGASSISELRPAQEGVFETGDAEAELDRLYDRIASRFWPLSVVRQKPVNTHIPERAAVLEPAIARTPDDPRAVPDGERERPLRLLPAPEPIEVVAEVPDGPPAHMIWRRVRYRFVKSAGPERIEAEWWRTGQRLALAPEAVEDEDYSSRKDKERQAPRKPFVPALEPFHAEAALRDYYVAEDDGGRRFWIFRQGLFGEAATAWFLQGFFA
jgi:protein ImuB